MYGRNKGKIAVLLLVSCTVGLPIAGFAVINSINKADREAYADVRDYMLKTSDGRVLTLPINENPISIVLKNVPDEDKSSVFEAIKSLDEISTNIDYTLLENNDITIKNKIYIGDAGELDKALGVTTYEYNQNTAKINYPVYINIDFDKCNKYYSSITGDNAVSAVVKHELMHTLGFSDLYGKDQKDESIMWNTLNLEDYTESDQNRIRRVYGGESESLDSLSRNYLSGYENLADDEILNIVNSYVNVSYPNAIQISALEEKKNKIKNEFSESERTM